MTVKEAIKQLSQKLACVTLIEHEDGNYEMIRHFYGEPNKGRYSWGKISDLQELFLLLKHEEEGQMALEHCLLALPLPSTYPTHLPTQRKPNDNHS